ncbi:MAG: YkgJ family cysteine cluster protein [Bacteroidia bacterium]|nr:YkgJ family cysteine cluster protein [Bacteroidia bacterium]
MNGTHQNICIRCGLCCDGTLFNHAKIKDAEPIATGFSFEIIQNETRGFNLPCGYLKEKICSIYETRPYAVCEAFKCKLLRSVNADKISFTDALKVVDETLALKAKIESQLSEHHPKNGGDSLPRKMKEFNAHFPETMSEVEFRKKYGKMLLDFFILNKKLSGSFRKSRGKKDIM